MSVWRWTAWAVGVALVAAAVAWLFTPAHAAPTPRLPLRVVVLDCDRAGTMPAIRLDRQGRMEASWRDGRGCVRWSLWVPR